MRIEVTATDISITETDKLVSGSKLVYTATFVFTGWDGLTKTAVFKPGRANKVEGIPTIDALCSEVRDAPRYLQTGLAFRDTALFA